MTIIIRTFARKIIKIADMKKLFIMVLSLMPLSMWAQANTWEQPEETQEQETVNKDKPNHNAKYLRGAVPVVNGMVEFSKTIEAPGKTADQIFNIVKDYMTKMTGEKNQINSMLIVDDIKTHEIGGRYEEWLVFKKAALALDQTRFIYVLDATCKNGQVELKLSHIQYLYEEQRKAERLKAEGWITDDDAVNKKNTKLYPITGKFRRKTIDRKDYIFDKIESLLK